jgi:hypothetical protein
MPHLRHRGGCHLVFIRADREAEPTFPMAWLLHRITSRKRRMVMNSISKTADHATQTVKDAASHARENLLDFGTQLLKVLERARDSEVFSLDSVLQRAGLQRREGMAQPMAYFAAGMVVGAGAGLLFAPTSGDKLRENIALLVSAKVDKLASIFRPATKAAEEVIEGAGVAAKSLENGARHDVAS